MAGIDTYICWSWYIGMLGVSGPYLLPTQVCCPEFRNTYKMSFWNSIDWALCRCTVTHWITSTSNSEFFLFFLAQVQLLLILKYILNLSFSLHANCCCFSSSPDVCASLFMDFLPHVHCIFNVLLFAIRGVYENENVIISLLCFKPSRKYILFSTEHKSRPYQSLKSPHEVAHLEQFHIISFSF